MTDWNALLAGDWPALLPAIAALPPAAQKKLGSWAKAQWQAELAHEHQQSLTEKNYGQQASEADIARWMKLLIVLATMALATGLAKNGILACPIRPNTSLSSSGGMAEPSA